MKKTIAAFLMLGCFSLSLQAQSETPKAAPATSPVDGGRFRLESTEMDGPVMKTVTLDKKITGRLPNGYRSVVTDSQRDEIYKIQKEYNEIIERLKIRIQLLESERNQKVDALLTTEQANRIRTTLGSLESEKQLVRGERTVPRRGRRAAANAERPAATPAGDD